ncbi:DMT family transporter [Sorangium cellulosum]|uniref:Permease n=1 Tax=Sorangium cellulosum TaxID=56 RepID=A0A150Q8U3_SORCE|nr:DMT family transporter [Sorangium cellulosum]KYF64389.1 permease [Sorangium cellulosum]
MAARQRVTARGAALFVVLASLAFATSGPLARYARPVHPLFIAFGRVALAAAALSLIDLRGIARSAAALSPRQRAAVLAAGLLLAVHFALFLCGLDRTSLAAALSLISLEPLAVVLCAWVFFRVRPTRSEQAGVLLATAGAALVARAAGSGDHRLSGDLMVVGATLLYGLYVSFARALRDALPARSYAALVYTSAAVFLAAALPVAPGALEGVSPPPAHAAVAIVALALVPTLVGHTAVQAAARRMSPAIVALVSPGETLGGIVIGALWLDAIPTATEVAGAAIILVGATVAILGSSSPAAQGAG